MREDTTIPFRNPALRDELSELVREGARRIIRQAVEAEFEAYLEAHAGEHDAQGRRAVVRNGYLPPREVLTGVGPVRVRVPRTRDRSGSGRRFRSELLPPYLRKTRRVEAVIPWLYLKGVSTNDFGEALTALFGESVGGLSPASVSRLKEGWEREYAAWREGAWHGEEFAYLWADGIYVNVRSGERRCLLVVVGCDARGRKRFLSLEAGFRESKESWKAVLLRLRERGVKAAKLAVGDGGLGLWSALAEVYPETRAQRCWVHKTANVLDKLPKSVQVEARPMLYEMWRAATRAHAEKAFERFLATWEAKYPKAAACLARDREELFAFYDFPAAHWRSIRTTNPIESTFATIRLRTAKTRNCLSEKTALSLIHQLAMSAEKRWGRLSGLRHLADVITDVRFIDGVNEKETGREAAELKTAIHNI